MNRCRLKFRREQSRFSVRSSEQGSISVESAIIMPLLSLLFMGLFDIGTALNHYLILTQLAQEGVRVAAQTPELEPGQGFLSSSVDGLPDSPTQSIIHGRFYFLYNLQPIYGLSNLSLTTGYTPPADGSNINEHTVTVNIQGDYNSVLMHGLKINISATSPYLF